MEDQNTPPGEITGFDKLVDLMGLDDLKLADLLAQSLDAAKVDKNLLHVRVTKYPLQRWTCLVDSMPKELTTWMTELGWILWPDQGKPAWGLPAFTNHPG